MKTMTCRQLSGACDKEFHANTFEEMAELSKQRGMEMFKKQDEAHLDAMKKMKALMKNPEAMNAWMEKKKKEFDELPDDKKKTITVEVEVKVPIEKVWKFWTEPEHVKKWNFASDDWECPRVENNLHRGGTFNYRMAAKDGSAGFDFEGTYTQIKKYELIEYGMGDGRKVTIVFENRNSMTRITETFEIEQVYPEDKQRSGWQSILNNFKEYVERK